MSVLTVWYLLLNQSIHAPNHTENGARSKSAPSEQCRSSEYIAPHTKPNITRQASFELCGYTAFAVLGYQSKVHFSFEDQTLMNLHQLREQRAAKVAAMKTLVDTAAAAGRDLSADEAKQFDAMKAEERTLSASIERHEHLASLEVRTAAPVGNDTAENLEGRVSLMNVLRAGVEGRSLTGAEAEYHQETERRTGRKAQGIFVPMGLLEKRANTTTTASELVGTDHRA